MASYEIEWKHAAQKDLRNIDRKFIVKILEAVESLATNPFPANYRKLKDSENFYRIRIGDYRVIYQVNSYGQIITIYHVRHRKEAYRK